MSRSTVFAFYKKILLLRHMRGATDFLLPCLKFLIPALYEFLQYRK
jgi:hypothetical protein